MKTGTGNKTTKIVSLVVASMGTLLAHELIKHSAENPLMMLAACGAVGFATLLSETIGEWVIECSQFRKRFGSHDFVDGVWVDACLNPVSGERMAYGVLKISREMGQFRIHGQSYGPKGHRLGFKSIFSFYDQTDKKLWYVYDRHGTGTIGVHLIDFEPALVPGQFWGFIINGKDGTRSYVRGKRLSDNSELEAGELEIKETAESLYIKLKEEWENDKSMGTNEGFASQSGTASV